MQSINEPICEQGLYFFSTTTASLTHELKNALAIIKENAGLLTDYMAMFEKGTPLAPDRLAIVARRIEDQVGRADNLIKSMNQYAHTVDDVSQVVDLNDILGLFVIVSQRRVAQQQVTLEFIQSASACSVTIAPFFLLTLLSQCLRDVLTFVQPHDQLVLGYHTNKDHRIYLQYPQGRTHSITALASGKERTELLSFLNADIRDEADAGMITIRFKTSKDNR